MARGAEGEGGTSLRPVRVFGHNGVWMYVACEWTLAIGSGGLPSGPPFHPLPSALPALFRAFHSSRVVRRPFTCLPLPPFFSVPLDRSSYVYSALPVIDSVWSMKGEWVAFLNHVPVTPSSSFFVPCPIRFAFPRDERGRGREGILISHVSDVVARVRVHCGCPLNFRR